MHIRSANADDISSVLRNEQGAHINPWNEQMLRDCFASQYRFWVMFEHDMCIGHMTVMSVIDQWELLNVVVAPHSQNLGFGSEWMVFLREQAAASHINSIFLEVRQSNVSAIKLYQKFQFLQVGTRINYYPLNSGREDALIMQLSVIPNSKDLD